MTKPIPSRYGLRNVCPQINIPVETIKKNIPNQRRRASAGLTGMPTSYHGEVIFPSPKNSAASAARIGIFSVCSETRIFGRLPPVQKESQVVVCVGGCPFGNALSPIGICHGRNSKCGMGAEWRGLSLTYERGKEATRIS